jgi:hypothetical protein
MKKPSHAEGDLYLMNTNYWPLRYSAQRQNQGTLLTEIWQALLAHLKATSEPRVWQTKTPDGETLWNAYDPISQLAIDQASTDELRVWLENLHYRS